MRKGHCSRLREQITLVVADQTSAVSVYRLLYWRSAAPVWEEQSPASLKCDYITKYQKITRIWQRAFRQDLTWMLPSFSCFHDDHGRSQLRGHWCPDLLAVLLLLIVSFSGLGGFIWISQKVHLARTKAENKVNKRTSLVRLGRTSWWVQQPRSTLNALRYAARQGLWRPSPGLTRKDLSRWSPSIECVHFQFCAIRLLAVIQPTVNKS